MCDYNAEDILNDADGCQNEGGLIGLAYYAFAEDIAQWPSLPASPGTFAESATLEGDFVMKPGKYFRLLESELEMSEYKGESQGSIGTLSGIGRHSFEQLTHSEQIGGFINACKNRRMALLFELPNGQLRAIGTQTWPARMASFAESTGLRSADSRLCTFDMEGATKLPLYYAGQIPLAPNVPANILVDEFGGAIVDENGEPIIYEE